MSGADRCQRCQRSLVSEPLRRLYRRGLRLMTGVFSVNETLCFQCFEGLSPNERREWLNWASALARE